MTTQRPRKRRVIVGIVFLAIIILGVAGFLAWRYLQPEASAPLRTPEEAAQNAPVSAEPVPADPYIGWKTYTSQRDGYELKYPPEWIVINETANDGPYIRNMPFTGGGYPEGYINLRVLRDEGVVSGSQLTPRDWYAKLGVTTVQKGPVTFTPDTVDGFTLNGMESKRGKSVFTETDEDIFLLYGDALYEVNMYPYGVSSDPEVQKILASFRLI